jgi:hypothetical protein
MKIRHILPADNLYACYLLDKSPYASMLKCQHRALVSRREDDEVKDAEWVDEIIGFVLDGTVVPADEVSEGTTFLYYVDRSDYTNEQFLKMSSDLVQWGQQVYQQNHPAPVPEVVTELASQPPRRKRRARGK